MTSTVVLSLVISLGLLLVAIWVIRFIAAGLSQQPDIEEIREVDVPYLCTVCGMSLTVTQAQDGDVDSPRHCREDMVET